MNVLNLMKFGDFIYLNNSCADPERSNLFLFFLFFFLVDEGREDPDTTISEPLLVRQVNTIKWRFAGGGGGDIFQERQKTE